MPTTCSVRGCRSRGSGEDQKIKYFRFPKDEAQRSAWLKAIRRENFVPTNNSMVCIVHFTEDDFQKRPDLIRLTNKAVPSVFACQENRVKRLGKHDRTVVPRSDKESSGKSVKKNCHYLSDHNYVLKCQEESPTLDDPVNDPVKNIDPSTCMIQTLKVDDERFIINEPFVLDLSKKDQDGIEYSGIESAETNERPIGYPGSDWKEIAMVQSMTINDLRKKVKILQQKIRRNSTKIRTLKNQLKSHDHNSYTIQNNKLKK